MRDYVQPIFQISDWTLVPTNLHMCAVLSLCWTKPTKSPGVDHGRHWRRANGLALLGLSLATDGPGPKHHEGQIHSPGDATRRMIVEIKKRHGLNTHLVPVPESASPIERLNRVALTAARMLTNFFLRWNDHGRCPGISRKRLLGT
jgi:hypothetical protein